jgi:transposase-like protein
MGIQHKIPADVKQQILKRVKEEGLPVLQVATEHGVSDKTIYNWLGSDVNKNPSWSEISKLKRENKMLLELVGELTVKLSQSKKKN